MPTSAYGRRFDMTIKAALNSGFTQARCPDRDSILDSQEGLICDYLDAVDRLDRDACEVALRQLMPDQNRTHQATTLLMSSRLVANASARSF